MSERTPVRPEEYKFESAILTRRPLKDHGVCQFYGTSNKELSDCISCPGKIKECRKYKSIQPYIPKVDPHYSLDTEIAEPLAFALSEKGNDHVLMVGPPGCGKSSLAMMLAAITDWEMVRFSCSEETRLHLLIGQWVTVGDQMVWVDGYATDALRNGKILLEDEADFMRPELRGALHPILEHDGTQTLQQFHPKTGKSFLEVVERHPDFRWISTANTIGLGDDSFQYHGTQFMNAASRDRYAIIMEMNYMDAEDEAEIVVNKTGIDEDTALQMAKVAAGMRELKVQKETDYICGMRRVLAWGKYHRLFEPRGEAYKAVKLALLNFAAPKDREIILKMIRTHGSHSWVIDLERNNKV
jgi:cobaltochelatase CobS